MPRLKKRASRSPSPEPAARGRLRKRSGDDSESDDEGAGTAVAASSSDISDGAPGDNGHTDDDDDDNDDYDDDDAFRAPRPPAKRQRRLDESAMWPWPSWTSRVREDVAAGAAACAAQADAPPGDEDEDDLDGFIVRDDEDEDADEDERRRRRRRRRRCNGGRSSTATTQTDDLPSLMTVLQASQGTYGRLTARSDHNRRAAATQTAATQLPERFSLSANNTSADAFEVYVQLLASAACDPTFIRTVVDERDPYFCPAMERIDRDLAVIKGVCDSTAWRPHFREVLEERPYLRDSVAGVSHGGSDCEACNRSNHTATVSLRLHGPKYDPVTFEVIEAEGDDEHDVLFHVGRHCARKAGYFHWLQHCRLQLYQTVGHEVLELQRHMTDDKVVEAIINNGAWIAKLHTEFEDKKARIMEFLHNSS